MNYPFIEKVVDERKRGRHKEVKVVYSPTVPRNRHSPDWVRVEKIKKHSPQLLTEF